MPEQHRPPVILSLLALILLSCLWWLRDVEAAAPGAPTPAVVELTLADARLVPAGCVLFASLAAATSSPRPSPSPSPAVSVAFVGGFATLPIGEGTHGLLLHLALGERGARRALHAFAPHEVVAGRAVTLLLDAGELRTALAELRAQATAGR